MEAAIAIRCLPVIYERLDAASGTLFGCHESPWYVLLDSRNIRQFPPNSVESVKPMINFLMSITSPDLLACDGPPKFTDEDGTCQHWKGRLLRVAGRLPEEYRLLLVTCLLKCFVSNANPSRYVSDNPLYNAILVGASPTVRHLLEGFKESLVQSWLREKDRLLLEVAIR